jgi:molybdopterin synthase catalytic subunit
VRVRVRLFAAAREAVGARELELELPPGATAREVLAELARASSAPEILAADRLAVAVNREYARDDRPLSDGDELALIPPVSGGAAPEPLVRITDEALDPAAVGRAVADPRAGAIVTFQGTTREVRRLDYEAYGEMAERVIRAILVEAISSHSLLRAAAEHRIGSVPLGEPSVVVAVAAAHRAEAFAGAREAIDRIKAEAPIWKREVSEARSEWVPGSLPRTPP